MSFIWNLPLFTIVLSLFSGPLCMMLKAKAARYYTLALDCALAFMCVLVLWYTGQRGASFTYPMGEFPAPWGNEIRAGVLEAMIALLFVLILFTSNLAGWHFLKVDIDESKINLYYSLTNLMTAALLALVWTNDMFTGYVFLEILTLTSCGVMIVREIGRTTLAAVRYMIMNLLGSGLFLLGVVLLYCFSGHLLMVPMRQSLETVAQDGANIPALSLSIGVLTIGLAIKSGLFPFHFWMPDTYGWSTPNSAALLSSLVSKGYIFLLFKIYVRAIGLNVIWRTPIGEILFVLGVLGMIFGSVYAMRVNNIDHMVAFSSAAQIGYIYMGLSLSTSAGMVAALFQVFVHAVTKSLIFLTTPYLAETNGNSLLFHNLQGSGLRNRTAGVFFAIGALSMIGIPIFGGFSVKLLFAQAAVTQPSTWRMIVVLLALAVSSLLNCMYFIRTLVRIFSRPQEPVAYQAENGPLAETDRMSYLVSCVLLTAMNLGLGLFSWVVVDSIVKGLTMFL